jgi:uncharacterized damage-inducible protein DinB
METISLRRAWQQEACAQNKEDKMKRSSLGIVLVVAIGLISPAVAQEPEKKAPMLKPAPGPSAGLLIQWNEIARKLIAMAEDFPEDKYDFKPAAGAQTFVQRLIHAAAANYYFTNLALGQKLPGEEEPPRSKFANKGAVVSYVRKSFADGAAAIQAKGDKGLLESVVDPFALDNPNEAGKSSIRLIDLARDLVEHSGEVYGQLTVYYRAAGMIPPESRPKKAALEIEPTLDGQTGMGGFPYFEFFVFWQQNSRRECPILPCFCEGWEPQPRPKRRS